MNQQRPFRSASLVSSSIGPACHLRLPVTTPPRARPSGDHGCPPELAQNDFADESQVTQEPDAVRIQAQVKQLHFWLKVFARFCRDDKE